MIIVHGRFPLKPHSRLKAIEAAKIMAEASCKEVGCISYEFYVGLRQTNELLLFQEWASPEALEKHHDTDHMRVFLAQLPDFLDGQVTTTRYIVQGSLDAEQLANQNDDEWADDANAHATDALEDETDPPKVLH